MPCLGEELFAENLTFGIGGCTIVANGLQRLGVKVGLAADLGNDPISHIMWHLLEEKGLDCSLIRKHPMPITQLSVALSYPKDRAFVTCFQRPQEPLKLADLLEKHPSRHVHICSLLTALECTQAVQIAHAHGATVSLDPGWDEIGLKDPHLTHVRGGSVFGDMAVEVISALIRKDGSIHTLNIPNRSALPDFAPDRVVEVPARVGMGSVTPLVQDKFPADIQGLLHMLAEYQWLAAQSIWSRDRKAMEHALAANPLVLSLTTARKMLDQMIPMLKPWLPAGF